MNKTLDPAIWWSVPIAPMPLLADLREAVLLRSTKRMPKWKFRLASDIVMQIQPKPANRTKANPDGSPFDCLAVIRDDATGAMLADPPRDGWNIRFRIGILGTAWRFHIHGVGYRADWREDEPVPLRDRLVALMPVAFTRLVPGMMLKPACLMCGKGLTDPISMARWIGPECAGTSSAVVPRTFILEDA